MQLYEDRRALHQIPEIRLELPETAQYLIKSLEKLRCQVFRPVGSAVCAFFNNGAESTIAFRADMDALAVTERTGAAYTSRHPGRMHACGHDGHMAVLLELARRLEEKKLDRNILLIFQPGEESPGGAHMICKTGILEKYCVEAVFGLHLWPGLPKGQIFSRGAEMMSRCSEVDLSVTGKAAHIGKAELAKDALAACVAFYTQAVAMEQAMPEDVPRLLKFGRMESGFVRNVISDTARLEGSVRAFSDAVFESMTREMEVIAQKVEKESGCKLDIHFSDSYPAVYNSQRVYEKVRKLAPVEELEAPSIISEDFSWYQRYVPGVFFFLGLGDTPALHAANFDFDEAVLEAGVALFETLAQAYR